MTTVSDAVLRRARRIRLLALDVDGVLTNGEIIYTAGGDEIKIFNVKDGLGITQLVRKGVFLAIITARSSAIVERRAKELGIHHLMQGQRDKLAGVNALIAHYEAQNQPITLDEIAYMGDDLPDLAAIKAVGLGACPADAAAEIKAESHWVSDFEGGKGAVRQLSDLILSTR